jgi:hypothetical protein
MVAATFERDVGFVLVREDAAEACKLPVTCFVATGWVLARWNRHEAVPMSMVWTSSWFAGCGLAIKQHRCDLTPFKGHGAAFWGDPTAPQDVLEAAARYLCGNRPEVALWRLLAMAAR